MSGYSLFSNFDLADKSHSWAAGIARCITSYPEAVWRGRLVWVHVKEGTSYRLPRAVKLLGLREALAPLVAAGCTIAFYSGGGTPDYRNDSLAALKEAGVTVFGCDKSTHRGPGTAEYDTLMSAKYGHGMTIAVEPHILRHDSPYPRSLGLSVHCQFHGVARPPKKRLMLTDPLEYIRLRRIFDLYLPPKGIAALGGVPHVLCLRDDRGEEYKTPAECEADVRFCLADPYEEPIVPMWLVSEPFLAVLAGGVIG